jgi:O-antigen ligase
MSRGRAKRFDAVPGKTTPLDLFVRAPIILAFLFGPFVVSGGLDSFRLPKELFFEACAILAAGALSIQLLLEWTAMRQRIAAVRWELALVGSALLWTAVTAALSTNRAISVQSLLWVACAAVLFVATVLAAQTWTVGGATSILLVPAVVNAAIATLQRLDLWTPLHALDPSLPLRLRTTALIGNADDLGSYLVAPLVMALALGLIARGRMRMASLCVAALLCAGILASGSLGAMISLVAAAVAMTLLSGGRRKLRLAVGGLAVLLATVLVVQPIRERLRSTLRAVRVGDAMSLTSNRVPAFMTAWAMFRTRPLIGLGPGTFHWWYMPYKVELNRRHPELTDAEVENFGEAHNDHLELLAVAGLPGYAIFLTAIARLGRLSARADASEQLPATFARVCSLPLGVSVFVLALTQFPLELAAPLGAILQSTALCVAWGRR